MKALGWLALPASVWAFYNPATGRWLADSMTNRRMGLVLIVALLVSGCADRSHEAQPLVSHSEHKSRSSP